MELEFACRVDIGVRESNDDRGWIPGKILNMETSSALHETPAAAVVCDGCGGYDGGGVAAGTVLQSLSETPIEALTDPEGLAQALERARQKVYEQKALQPQFSAMCTTVAGCVFTDEATLVFHAGDSRVYRYDGMVLAPMTVDHSLVQTMVDMGRITEEEALTDPRRNVINRCIGVDCEAPEIYVSRSPIAPGEIYLICSDGFWEVLRSGEIMELLALDLPLEQKAQALVDAALNRGSQDNVTVCLCAAPGESAREESEPFVLD